MRAVVLDRPGRIEVRDVPDPAPALAGVVVRVMACGVCGTDLHIVDGEFPPTPYPITPGHEFSGEVVAVGTEVAHRWREGDRVAVDPSLFCGHCGACRIGRGNLCANWAAIGDTVDGAFAEYTAVPAANLYALADGLDYRQGALIEPLSCALHGLKRLGSVLGETVLLVGAGTMGLLLQQLLLAAGAQTVTVVDRAASRLGVAEQLGAAGTAASVEELGDKRFGLVVDATGAPAAIESAFGALDRGGRMMVFGVSPAGATVRLSPFRIYNDEITIVGSMAVLNSYLTAAEMMAAGTVVTAPLLTHSMALENFVEALGLVRRGEGIKIQVEPGAG